MTLDSADKDDIRAVEEARSAVLDEDAVGISDREDWIAVVVVEADSLNNERIRTGAGCLAEIRRVAGHAVRDDCGRVEVLVAVDRLTVGVLDDRGHDRLEAKAAAVHDQACVAADCLAGRGSCSRRALMRRRRDGRDCRCRRLRRTRCHLDVDLHGRRRAGPESAGEDKR